MLHDIIEVRPMKAHKLRIKFDDGVVGEVDVAQLIKFDGIFASLKEPKHFAEVFVNRDLGTVCWPNGADLDPVVLYSTISGTKKLGSASYPSTPVHDALYFAIANKRLIRFKYKKEHDLRTAEPHDYGIMGGSAKLLVYQTEGFSNTSSLPCWKVLNVEDLHSLRILKKSFLGGRPVPSAKHKKWDQIFIRVSPAA